MWEFVCESMKVWKWGKQAEDPYTQYILIIGTYYSHSENVRLTAASTIVIGCRLVTTECYCDECESRLRPKYKGRTWDRDSCTESCIGTPWSLGWLPR